MRITATLIVIALLAAGCASAPRAPSPGPDVQRERVGEPGPPSDDSTSAAIVRAAVALIGTPYRYGGNDPRGFDCSGLVFYSFERAGLKVPRTAADQRRAARLVKREALLPGDLVFFRTAKGRADHVGIYTGDGRFIHAPSSGRVVSYAYLDEPYYRTHFVSAGRLK